MEGNPAPAPGRRASKVPGPLSLRRCRITSVQEWGPEIKSLDPELSWRTQVTTSMAHLYLNPKSMQNDSPKPPKIAIKAIILHTFSVQVEMVLNPKFDPVSLLVRLPRV